MPPEPPPATTAPWPRGKMFWVLVAALALGQLAALWMLCSYQVHSAQARNQTLRVERMALADCLRYGHEATPPHCAARLAAQHDPQALMAATENTAYLNAAPPSRVTLVDFSRR